MLSYALALALLVILVVMVVWRRHGRVLMSIASIIGALLMLFWLQDLGLLPGTRGPLTPLRAPMPDEYRR